MDFKTFNSNRCQVTANAQVDAAQLPVGLSTTGLSDYDTVQVWCFFHAQSLRDAQAAMTSATVKFLVNGMPWTTLEAANTNGFGLVEIKGRHFLSTTRNGGLRQGQAMSLR